MSVAGGLSLAVERALAVDATALQIFVKSSRRWSAPPLDEREAALFREASAEAGLAPYSMAHASYLINLASPNPAVRERSIAALADEANRCSRLEIPSLVLHPGSHGGAGARTGLDRVVAALDQVLEAQTASRWPRILLENTAGQGATLGHRFEELGYLLQRSRHPERLGVCLDTCHALAAGYELRDRRSYRASMAELDRQVGLGRVLAFHLNDSKHELGSRRDRHEHIGKGRLGLEPFRMLLNDRRFRDTPMILETPKGPELAEDRENLRVLRGLLAAGRR
jgi:deoxyribonuclease-4